MTHHFVFSRKFIREDKAAAMIEFAIVLPLLLLLVGGIIDFGRVFFDINNLTNAAREGARVGAVATDLSIASLNSIRGGVIARFNANSIKSSSLTTANVFVTREGSTPNVTVRVRIINYQLDPIFLGAIVRDEIREVKAEFRHEFQ